MSILRDVFTLLQVVFVTCVLGLHAKITFLSYTVSPQWGGEYLSVGVMCVWFISYTKEYSVSFFGAFNFRLNRKKQTDFKIRQNVAAMKNYLLKICYPVTL